MSYCNSNFLFLLHLILVFVKFTKCQLNINNSCPLSYSYAPGRCTYFQDCPSAVNLVKSRSGTPNHCGFEGLIPIVCCENLIEERQGANNGNKSMQKCYEIHKPFFKPPKKGVHAVAGGRDALPFQYTHMAALGYGFENEITWACGGSLITGMHVLTAAHCIHGRHGPVKFVRLGDLDLKISTDIAKPQNFNVSRTFTHPDYRAPSVYHDIAIIELFKAAIFTDFVRPACLGVGPPIFADPTFASYIVTGWGATAFNGPPANHLQVGAMFAFPLEECERAYAKRAKYKLQNGLDHQTQICAGDQRQDTCRGDSEGPLQVPHPTYKTFIIYGVTSFGTACGNGIPSIYTKVSHYIDWIESIVWPM